MKALIKNIGLALGLTFFFVTGNAQSQLTGAKSVSDINDYASVKIYDKKGNLLEQVILMDKLSHEEAINLVEGSDLLDGVNKAAYYTIVSPNNFTSVKVYAKNGKLLDEIILKDQLTTEEAKRLLAGSELLTDYKKAAYYTINDSEEKIQD